MCQKGSVSSVSSVRAKTSTKYASSPVGVTSHTTPLPAGKGLGEGPLSCGLEMCAKNLRELCALCERKNSPTTSPIFFFSQNNTDEQNTQRPTETLSQPISQSVTTNRSLTQHDPKKEKELTTSTSKSLPSYQHSISFSISGIVSRLKTGLFTPARFCCR